MMGINEITEWQLCFYLFFAASYGGRALTHNDAVAKEKNLPKLAWNELYIRNCIKMSKLQQGFKKGKRPIWCPITIYIFGSISGSQEREKNISQSF